MSPSAGAILSASRPRRGQPLGGVGIVTVGETRSTAQQRITAESWGKREIHPHPVTS